MAELEKAYPGSVRRLVSEAGLEEEMFSKVSGLRLPESTVLKTERSFHFLGVDFLSY